MTVAEARPLDQDEHDAGDVAGAGDDQVADMQWPDHWTTELEALDDEQFIRRAILAAQVLGGIAPDVEPLVKEFVRRLQLAYDELDDIAERRERVRRKYEAERKRKRKRKKRR